MVIFPLFSLKVHHFFTITLKARFVGAISSLSMQHDDIQEGISNQIPSFIELRTHSRLSSRRRNDALVWFSIRLSFLQHPVRCLSQMPCNSSNCSLMPPFIPYSLIQPAGMMVRVAPTIEVYCICCFYKSPFEISIDV